MDRQAVRALACKGGLEGAVETRCVSRSLRTFPAAHFCPASVRREQCVRKGPGREPGPQT
eukprot:12548840-Ditylum_brightwellii.AAC.1